jgi:hypothetical protein
VVACNADDSMQDVGEGVAWRVKTHAVVTVLAQSWQQWQAGPQVGKPILVPDRPYTLQGAKISKVHQRQPMRP